MDEKKQVRIDPHDLYARAYVFGLLCRIIKEEDERLFTEPHILKAVGLFASAYSLNQNLDEMTFQAAVVSLVDVAQTRSILGGTDHPVKWPDWDPEDPLTDVHDLVDLFLLLTAWNMAAETPDMGPEHFLGPLFTFSAFGYDGVKHGFLEEEGELVVKKDSVREQFYSTLRGDDKDALLSRQITMFANLFE